MQLFLHVLILGTPNWSMDKRLPLERIIGWAISGVHVFGWGEGNAPKRLAERISLG